jgi:hypothetical protein
MLFSAARMTLDYQKLDSRRINLICSFDKVISMQKERKQVNSVNIKELPLEKLLKKLPPPPPEHTHEIMMEKRVKQLLKEQEKKQ